MSSRLEQFINDHRDEFDGDEPSKKVWENIQQQMNPGHIKQASVVRLSILKWSVAAAIAVILIGGGVWYLVGHNGNTPTQTTVAVNRKPAVDSPTTVKPPVTAPDTSSTQVAQNKPSVKEEVKPGKEEDNAVSDYQKETYYYAKLIEIKHNELRKIEKDEPLLYKKFAGDVAKLDSVYHSLQKQLPKNSNREELLEAMIQNLQLQIGLLNHQLDIIKQINHSKKSEYEKAYKSI